VERVVSHLDAVDAEILRLAPASYVYGQLPGVMADIRRQLPATDARVRRLGELSRSHGEDLKEADRDLIASTQRAASAGFLHPSNMPVCFNPVDGVVCPTSMTDNPPSKTDSTSGQPKPFTPAVDTAMRNGADRWDIALIEGIGLLAAAVAAARSLSQLRGTATPFHVPLALAVLKLPTGALTAILGLLLMRGGFVPGLGALDTPAQIIAWAILLGYSQQLLTQFVDRHAQRELDNFGRSDIVRKQDELAVAGGLDPAMTAPPTSTQSA
jgi:hypothetical protein